MIGEVLEIVEESMVEQGKSSLAKAQDLLSKLDNPSHTFKEEGSTIKVILEHTKQRTI